MELRNSYAIEWVEIVKENGKEEEEEEQIKPVAKRHHEVSGSLALLI